MCVSGTCEHIKAIMDKKGTLLRAGLYCKQAWCARCRREDCGSIMVQNSGYRASACTFVCSTSQCKPVCLQCQRAFAEIQARAEAAHTQTLASSQSKEGTCDKTSFMALCLQCLQLASFIPSLLACSLTSLATGQAREPNLVCLCLLQLQRSGGHNAACNCH